MSQEAKNEISNLKNVLNQYSYEYHVLDSPTVDDAVYDSLFTRLKKLELDHPEFVDQDSPTQRVGNETSDVFKSVMHSQRMVSLNDVFNKDEVAAWIKRTIKLIKELRSDLQVESSDDLVFFGDIKKDGLACALIYQEGLLKQGITRGDGYAGEDVTQNIRTIGSIPLRLREAKGYSYYSKGRTEVRGEIVMYKKDFESLNKKRAQNGLPEFANPRNLSAGTIRQLDPKLVAERKLHFLAYELLRDNPREVTTNDQAYKDLKNLGFMGGDYATVLPSEQSLYDFAETWKEKRHSLPYNTDGLVIKLNDRKLYSDLGFVGKNPRGAIAFKYPAEKATTKVLDIFISIGRTGAATPVAILEPVTIAGSRVQMATLHNEDEVARKDIRIGDHVVVHKAGDIIPEIIEPLVKLRSGDEVVYNMPSKCPDCANELVREQDESVRRCPNNVCPSRLQRHIEHFASKGALDIEGLGEKNVLALLDSGIISDTADLYSITKDQLLNLDRFAELSAQNLIDAINQKRTPSLAKFIFSLGIRHVGAQTAIDLANHFHRLDTLGTASYSELKDVEGVGEKVAESITAWFSSSENQTLLAKFRTYGVWPADVKKIGGPLSGKSFVITGSLSSMSREEAGDKVRSLGGTFQSSVGRGTTYLVMGDKAGQSKADKAVKLGTEVINEAKLLEMFNM